MTKAQEDSAPASGRHLSSLRLLAYSLPAMSISLFMLPMNIVIPAFYAANTTATLTGIGLVAGFARLFDAVTDPLIGYFSDTTRGRLGPAQALVCSAGAAIGTISVYFLFQPPPESGLIYYVIASTGVFLGFTLFEIPNRAWGMELSHDYLQRARISTYLAVFFALGQPCILGYPRRDVAIYRVDRDHPHGNVRNRVVFCHHFSNLYPCFGLIRPSRCPHNRSWGGVAHNTPIDSGQQTLVALLCGDKLSGVLETAHSVPCC